MLGKVLIDIQNTLKTNRILISFSGRLSQGIIEELGEAIKKHMEAEERAKNDIYNVFAIFVEQTQNIRNYATRKFDTPNYEMIANSGIVIIGRKEEGYYISSGNIIEKKDCDKLINHIEGIVPLDKIKLKTLYKERMKQGIYSDMGAGVGLIDIARKASKPIEYSMVELDEEYSFFTLNVVV